MKRKTHLKIERQKRNLKIIIGLALSATVFMSGILFANEFFSKKNDIKSMEEVGMYNLLPINSEDNVNFTVKGSENPRHTIVPISNIGVQDFNAYMDYITQPLQKNNRITMLDRLGTGYSDDTFSNRTIDAIVEEYRTILQTQGIKGPYILVAHQYGALYATYWQSIYPEEIEGIVYIDPVLLDEASLITYPEWQRIFSITNKVGLQRWIYHYFYKGESTRIPFEHMNAAYALNVHSAYTFGYFSEVDNLQAAFDMVKDTWQKTDILKMYINSSYAFETTEDVEQYIEFVNQREKITNGNTVYNYYKGTKKDAFIAELIEKSKTMTESRINKIAEDLGNCYVVKMPGDTYVYEQTPAVMKAALTGFINYMDGTEAAIYERYIDSINEAWKQQATALTQ